MPNPLTVVDDAVLAALTAFTPLTNIIPTSRIARYDRKIDLRQISNVTTIAGVIWVVPTTGTIDPYVGAERVKWMLNYEIGYQRRSADVEDLRLVQYEMMRAYLLMTEWTLYGGTTNGLKTSHSVSPWEWMAITPTSADATKEGNVQIGKWTSLIDLSVHIAGDRAAIQV